MHQVASFVSSFLLSPFNWVIFLITATFFSRKASFKKTCNILALCVFLIFSNAWLLNWYAKHWQPAPAAINKGFIYSCGIVPGGFGTPDADGNGYFNSTADRFIQAVKLYKLGEITHILISGGNGKDDKKDFREGAWAKSELIAVGIPDSVIFAEDRSTNTSENAGYAKQILDSLQLKPPYLLITSAQHMPRASLLFAKAGLATVAFPCNYTAGRGVFNLSSWLPQIAVLTEWNGYLKETAAYFWYRTN